MKEHGKEARDDRSRSDRQAAQKGDRYWASDLIGKNVSIAGGEGKQRIAFNMSEDKIKGMKPIEKEDKKRINDPNFMSRVN